MPPSGEIIVKIDSQLEHLIPKFLAVQKDQFTQLKAALGTQDFESLRMLGHKMHGSSGGYGFDEIGRLGKKIENAAAIKDMATLTAAMAQLEDYLPRIKVEYLK